ncbi:MAG: sugar ABC transporter substrate-binding protein [Firmicutes bacterium]|nr:sugar ABC transporter substrate-binding protein [Bacillota bacterium]
MSVMKKTFFLILLCAVALLLLAYKTTIRPVEIGICVPDSANPFVGWLASAVKEQAAQDGINVQVADAGNNPVRQLEQIENFIAMKVKSLAIMPIDPGNVQPAIEKAQQQGIKVLVIGTDTSRYDVMMYMDQYLAGKMVAEMGIEWLEKNILPTLSGRESKKPKTINISATTTVDLTNRSQGMIDKMQEWGKAEVIVAPVEAQATAAAVKILENMWQKNSDAVLLLCYDADAALGVNEYLLWQSGINRAALAIFAADWSPQIQEVLNASVDNKSLFRGSIQVVGPVIQGRQIPFAEATYRILKGFVHGNYAWGFKIFNMIEKKCGLVFAPEE